MNLLVSGSAAIESGGDSADSIRHQVDINSIFKAEQQPRKKHSMNQCGKTSNIVAAAAVQPRFGSLKTVSKVTKVD
jgi:hypothetical protein